MVKKPDKKKGTKESKKAKEWILNALKDPPKTIGGNPGEDLKEYDYDDI